MPSSSDAIKATGVLLAMAALLAGVAMPPPLAAETELIDRPWGDLDLTEVDYELPVRFMAPKVGRYYTVQQSPIPRTAEERTRQFESAGTPVDQPAPAAPTWLTMLDLSLVASPAKPAHPAQYELYLPGSPWRPTFRWTKFDLIEGSRHDEFRTLPAFMVDARLVPGYRPPTGYAALEQLPGEAALVPGDVAATVLLRVDDYLFFDAKGRLLGIQDGRGNGYTYQWIADETTTRDASTVALRDVRIEHTEGRWMRATWRQTTDRSAANKALHTTNADMVVVTDDESTTITYTFLPVAAAEATQQPHLLSRVVKEWMVAEHPGIVQRRVDDYTYAADAACIAGDAKTRVDECTDSRRPKTSPNLLMTQRVRTTELADKPAETKHAVYAYRWIPNGDMAWGRPVSWSDVVPVCTIARAYEGAPPATGAPTREERMRYGSSNDPARWRHMTGRVFGTETVGARVLTMEEELDPERTTVARTGMPDLERPSTAWHNWVESPDLTQPLMAGMTMVSEGWGLGSESSHYHRYLTYDQPTPERLATLEEVRNNDVGGRSPRQSWDAFRQEGGERYVRRMAYHADDGSPAARVPERFEEMDDSVLELTFDPSSRAINLPVRFDFAMRDKPTTHTIMVEYDDPARNPSKARGLPTVMRRAGADGQSRATDVRLDLFYEADGILDRVEVRSEAETEPRRVLRRNGKRIDERWRYEFDGQPRRFGRLTDYSAGEGVTLVLDDLMAQTLDTRPRESVRDVIRGLLLAPQY